MNSDRVSIRRKREKERKRKRNRRILCSFISLLVITISFVGVYVNYTHKKIYASNDTADTDKVMNYEKVSVKEELPVVDYKEGKGITNILLVGVDARTKGESTRSDAMTILTIDEINKNVKLTSIMRDVYTYIPGHGYEKMNHAYAYGKIGLLQQTIKSNFNINIDKYVIINFQGFKALIDELNGVKVNVQTEKELKGINDTIDIEIDDILCINNKRERAQYLVKTGEQVLNGQQALAFSRLRKVGNGTTDRVRRQREVLSSLLSKIKETSIFKYPKILNSLTPYVTTNLEVKEILNMAYTVNKIGITNEKVLQLQIPTNELNIGKIISKKKGWVHLMDKEANIKVLHNFIFKNIKYNSAEYLGKLNINYEEIGESKEIAKKPKTIKYNIIKNKKIIHKEDDDTNDERIIKDKNKGKDKVSETIKSNEDKPKIDVKNNIDKVNGNKKEVNKDEENEINKSSGNKANEFSDKTKN